MPFALTDILSIYIMYTTHLAAAVVVVVPSFVP